MGKGTRNRQVRAEDKVVAPSKQVQKKNKSVFYGTVAMAVFAVVLVVFLVFNALTGAGVFLRANTAAESADFEVDGAMMSYFVYTSYNDYVQYYQQYYQQYFGSYMQTSGLTVYDMIGIDPNESLKKQVMDTKTGQTWFQYFADQASTEVKRLLVMCQAAKAAGVELDDEDIKSIDSQIQLMEIYYPLYGYSSFKAYLNNTYGEGVKEDDVRRAMELQTLASKYYAEVQEGYHDAATLETVEAFFDKNKNDYISADYLSYTFKVTLSGIKAESENKDKKDEELKQLYEEKKAELIAKAEQLAACKTLDEYKAAVKELWKADYKESKYETYYKQFLKDSQAATEDEKKQEAEEKATEKFEKEADDYVEGLLKEGHAHPGEDKLDKDELSKWIFGKGDVAAATVNSIKQITDDPDADAKEEKDKKYTYSITVYYLTRAASRVEDTTRNFHYIMLQAAEKDTDKLFTEDQIKAMFEEFKKSEKKDADALKKVAESWTETYSKDGKSANANSMEEYREGGAADEVDEWLFNAERKAGDYEIIRYTEYDSTKKKDIVYYIMIVVDDIGPEEWYIDARDGMVADQMTTWEKEQSDKYAVEISSSAINKVRI